MTQHHLALAVNVKGISAIRSLNRDDPARLARLLDRLSARSRDREPLITEEGPAIASSRKNQSGG